MLLIKDNYLPLPLREILGSRIVPTILAVVAVGRALGGAVLLPRGGRALALPHAAADLRTERR